MTMHSPALTAEPAFSVPARKMAIWLFITANRAGLADAATTGGLIEPAPRRAAGRPLVLAAALVIYAAVLPALGFVVSSFALVVVASRLMGAPSWWRPALLALGITGVSYLLFVRWLGVPLYVALGWVAVFVLTDILHFAGVASLVLLATGGVLYTVGGIAYAIKKPNPWPGTFGYHEVFHAMTIVAATCHYIAVYFAVFNSPYTS